MLPEDIQKEIENIQRTAKSPLEIQLKTMGLLCKCLVAQKVSPDQYMQDIADFHTKFGLPYNAGPRLMTPDMAQFRIKFLQEELDEFKDAIAKNDLEQQFDALIDLVYIALGTAYLQGLPFQKGWQRVHSANMKKERTNDPKKSKRGSSLDIVKPPGWTPPSLTDLVNPTLID